jgi:hypothetical protein
MRSFDLVDFKVLETHYFLQKINAVLGPPEIDFIFSAFTSASRSITFTLQAVLKDIVGFEDWYLQKQELLKKNPLAKFFVDARNFSQKIGVIPIAGGTGYRDSEGEFKMLFYFERTHPDFKNLPESDVAESCNSYFSSLLEIVYDCYVSFGTTIDAHQYYTKSNFSHLGKTIEDAEEEIYGIRGYTYVEGWPEAYRWNMIRDRVPGCRITQLFRKYLSKDKPHPPIPPRDPSKYNEEYWVPPCIKRNNS